MCHPLDSYIDIEKLTGETMPPFLSFVTCLFRFLDETHPVSLVWCYKNLQDLARVDMLIDTNQNILSQM